MEEEGKEGKKEDMKYMESIGRKQGKKEKKKK